ncbi:MAG: DUF4199 domain-containing protein [Prevotella sp.]|nr:DUF4199 domain-containing protein [Prevotella sp.]MDD4534687.1 DUF4199 domain-containing protein [Prevotella sp.]
MINVAALVQVRAFARQYGLFLSLLWIASFLLVVLAPSSSFGSLLALSTPFFVGWLLSRFRDYALDGVISFRRGFVFSCYTFFYASLIFVIVQYVYFRFFDQGAMMTILMNSIKMMEEANASGDVAISQTLAQMKQGMSLIGDLTPLELSFALMMQNLFYGVIFSLPIALICRRTKPSNKIRN